MVWYAMLCYAIRLVLMVFTLWKLAGMGTEELELCTHSAQSAYSIVHSYQPSLVAWRFDAVIPVPAEF